ncbi:hypothetical protein [Candidatus Methylacidithermus pantelleriae]|uniref:Uncharacterized protein n=1 Tax=Candidatus Methylacidithermus pantelleriae TaxID=2744239 RepID=A0A8J2FSR8_9BACT|nr:hypothetical protein [Candidatus Methylacidithermus pantelleriae]CAF0700414.1 hypothetical protein MPNT_360016 [Candidatus Methylacidithermus pantelleriae]
MNSRPWNRAFGWVVSGAKWRCAALALVFAVLFLSGCAGGRTSGEVGTAGVAGPGERDTQTQPAQPPLAVGPSIGF